MVTKTATTDSLEELVAEELLIVRAQGGLVGDLETTYVDLPAGTAAVVESTRRAEASPSGKVEQSEYVVFLHEGTEYVLGCFGVTRDSDVWLSIAKSFEFLPAEG